MTNASCHVCTKSEEQAPLRKCPVCFKHYCEDHGHQRSGVGFCSNGCSQYFFFGDPDD
jgi:hypothetical protein